MTGAIIAAAGPPVSAPQPAHGPPGKPPGKPFEPVLQSQQERPAREATERDARPAHAEGTEPGADDHGKEGEDAPVGAAASNGVGREVSRAAHEAHAQGLPVADAVHAVLASLRGPAGEAAPAVTAPAVAEPVVAEPVVAEPVVAEPVVAEPVVAEPVVDGVVPVVQQDAIAPAATTGTPAAPAPETVVAPVPVETAADTETVTEDTAPALPAPTAPVGQPPAADGGQPPAEADPAAPPTSSTQAPVVAPQAGEAAVPATDTQPATVAPVPTASRPAAVDEAPAAEAPAEAVDPEAEVATAPSRPGHVPEHGRGGEMRREDPPAHGWHRKHDPAPEAAPAAPAPAQAAPVATDPVAADQARPAAPAPATAPAPVEQTTGAVERPETPIRAGSRLAELADTVRTVVRLAAEDGRTSARITLYPAELGEVRIRLRYEAGGVAAEVVAESQQAAQALQQAAPELRRSLESQGLNLLWLDVRSGDAENEPAWLGEGTTAASADDDASEAAEEHHILPGRLLAPGSTIDVFA